MRDAALIGILLCLTACSIPAQEASVPVGVEYKTKVIPLQIPLKAPAKNDSGSQAVDEKPAPAELKALCYFPVAAAAPRPGSNASSAFPVVVLSPGGEGKGKEVYGQVFGQPLSYIGIMVVVADFEIPKPEDRAKGFSAVLDELKKQNEDSKSPLQGKIDLKRAVAMGHSRGGWAALLAVQDDARFSYAVGLGASGPFDSEVRVPSLLTGGTEDMESAQAIFKASKGRASKLTILEVVDMTHNFQPKEKLPISVKHVTAWLRWNLLEQKEAAALFSADAADVKTGLVKVHAVPKPEKP